jgi:hypothetical protein
VCQAEFENLIKELSSTPILQAYSFQKALATDASQKSIGGVLTQEGKPVAYISKQLSKTEQRWSNIEREAFAIVWSVKRPRQLLLGRKFTLASDHKPLQYIFDPAN